MQSVADKILEGNFNNDEHTLNFSSPVIELNVNEGSVYEGSFKVYGPNNELTEGTVSSTRPRMKCLVQDFSGTESEVPFSFDTRGMSEGDCFKGEFRIISNQGEYMIPYDIHIGSGNIDTSLGNIRNLFHFTNLARSNWEEAVKLFYSDAFESILNGADKLYLSVYKCLKEGYNEEQNLEEFLLTIKKKQPIEYIIEEPNVKIDSVLGQFNNKYVLIDRNGWGYSHLFVKTTDDFIVLSADEICDDDFHGNRARLAYSILEERLHEGKNFAEIILYNAYNEIHVRVCVTKNSLNRKIFDESRTNKHHMIDLMHYYEAFRSRKISASTWMLETDKIVEKMREASKDNVYYDLMHAQLLITQERYNEAKWMLEQATNMVENTDDETLYCYYKYLTTLVYRDNADEVSQIVERIYLKNKSNWRVGWLLLYLSEEYAKFPEKRWEMLKNQFDLGSRSPVLYVEAYQVLLNNPTIMGSLDSFEIQTLTYMAKKEILTADIIERFIYLFERSRIYKKSMCALLYECYKVLPTVDVLKAICILLINLGITDNKAFKWYESAISEELKITRLYEYYLMSIDMDAVVEIPKLVLLYFAFDSSLDVMHNSYLYAYVYRNKALFPEVYESYKETIERFVSFQILKGNNNRFLAYLYKNIITESRITNEISRGLLSAIFIHRVLLNRDNICKVIVKYDNLLQSEEYQVSGKEIYIPLYGNNYQLMLVSKDGNCFVRDNEYEIERLMVPDKLANMILPYIEDELKLNLWVCEHGKDIASVSMSNVRCMRHLADSSLVNLRVRKSIKQELLRFYYDEDMMDELDSLLNEISYEDTDGQFYADIIKTFVLRGMYEKAYEWICLSGGESIDAKIILKLCSRLIAGCDFERYDAKEDKMLTALIFRAFISGKYDERTLKYLCRFFNGTCKEMNDIWKTAEEYGVDAHEIAGRILVQFLYSNAFIFNLYDIVNSYYEKSVNTKVVLATLAQVCFDYFVNENVIREEYMGLLLGLAEREIELPFSCKLAFTKFYAENQDIADDNINRLVAIFLREIMSKGLYFAYFKEYVKVFTFMHRFQDKTFVEYRTKQNAVCNIRYVMEKTGSADNEYLKEDMKNMYYGIFVKMFVLFFGERMQYYIMENNDGEEVLTQSGSFSASDVDNHAIDSKYNLINDITIARTLGDYGVMDELLVEYFRDEYLRRELFTMLD